MIKKSEVIEVSKMEIGGEPFIVESSLKELYLIRRPFYMDNRGSFQEVVRIPDLKKTVGCEISFQQTQISVSKPGVIRGIHVEPQDKLVTPLTGHMYSVVVDVRPNSPTFKKWVMFRFDNTSSDIPKTSLFIPRGLGNSICVPYESPQEVLYYYSVTEVYNPATAGRGIRYDDAELDIPWPIKNPIISQNRDASLPSFSEFIEKYGEEI